MRGIIPVMAKPASGTPAIVALEAAGVSCAVHTYELTESAGTYGEAVAAVLGVDPDRLFKTLVTEVDGNPTVAIVPVSSRLSTRSLARAAGGKKADMIDPDVAERLTGYVTGGISPFGQKRRLPTFVDETIELWDTVYVSAGKRGLQVEVAPADLIRLLDATVAELI
jgi:Cys-tRNA(Pro)/Cys-tRNA(Cys) deacylase